MPSPNMDGPPQRTVGYAPETATPSPVRATVARLIMVLQFTIADGKIVEIDAISDPERVRRLDLKVFSG